MISVDTEADNQWDTSHGITTENALFIPRFQSLCEEYGFKPVYLTDYEMALDPRFSDYAAARQESAACEIGMHLHAWTTPPLCSINRITDAREYLIEYPDEIMEAKIDTMTRTLEKVFGKKPVVHRSGRWVMNDVYFRLLVKYGYQVDCSVTPLVDWSTTVGATGMTGNDYRTEPLLPYRRKDGLLEIPVSIRRLRYYALERVTGAYSAARELRNMVRGNVQWMRPFDLLSERGMLRLLDSLSKENAPVVFMIHSSELMPGGGPGGMNKEDIDRLFGIMNNTFRRAYNAGYRGCTMSEYYQYLNGEKR